MDFYFLLKKTWNIRCANHGLELFIYNIFFFENQRRLYYRRQIGRKSKLFQNIQMIKGKVSKSMCESITRPLNKGSSKVIKRARKM